MVYLLWTIVFISWDSVWNIIVICVNLLTYVFMCDSILSLRSKTIYVKCDQQITMVVTTTWEYIRIDIHFIQCGICLINELNLMCLVDSIFLLFLCFFRIFNSSSAMLFVIYTYVCATSFVSGVLFDKAVSNGISNTLIMMKTNAKIK